MTKTMAGRFGPTIALALAGLTGTAALAEVNRLQPDFTFRRVGVPQSGQPRITAQIVPGAPSAIRAPDAPDSAEVAGLVPQRVAAPPLAPPAAPADTRYGWFWDHVSPELTATGPGRLQDALNALRQGQVAAPRVQALQDLAQAHGRTIMLETIGTRVSPALVLAVIQTESGGRVSVESHAGAAGLMQLMPATAERFGVTDRMDPGQNIRGGVAYLDWLLGHFDGDPVLAIAAYNAGEGAVRDNSGVPPYAETRDYVPKVLAAFAVARGLCQTPPLLISDGCVFAINNS